MENLKELFVSILDKFEEKDDAAIMAALSYVNLKFIQFLDDVDCDVIESEDFSNVLEFGEYFYEEFGDKTIDSRIMMFNGEEPLILDAYITAGTDFIEEQILEYANNHMTKKIKYDLQSLKLELSKLANKYENIYLEKQGTYMLDDNICDISDCFEYDKDDFDDELLDDFLKTFLFIDGSILFIQCDNNTPDGILYGVQSENHSWKKIEAEALKEILNELDDEDLDAIGFENLIVDEIEKKY